MYYWRAPDASEQELYAALDAAWVSEFLPLLPQGVDTPLGNHASRLSVGQAQRVAVARALLNPCQLLLLDEPAASLDAHSEQRVMQALKAASKRQTTLMVTHQLEDLADWDAIWVMQDGAIVRTRQLCRTQRRQRRFCDVIGSPSGGYLNARATPLSDAL
ncbi:cysteine/glutathione ABC transporter membrane /ATP-binding component [Salmonella enterica subsp. enterica]|uniref:Cysteine/glutathione ABC transporter membrane /ATP-binding component n=1 Tax=Salmonella enterica I TaxID=59201 RepID=A0A447PGP1_SALET|nr:cysteine/glutathione ABC transporter membrane /ATP-binding component [Salmonella enterica subsp. enterica]